MIGLLQRVMGSLRGAEPAIDYEESKRVAASGGAADRRALARQSRLRPELLYYLASDADPEVRAAVAANEATPLQADLILAHDRDETVRVDLARKIAQLAPGLSSEQHERLREMTYEVLEILVRDQMPRVRQVIAETLKDVADAPPDVIRSLARDSAIVVAEPVLQFSPALTDEDLLEIIGNSPVPGALAAIARRARLPADVADAIGTSPDADAIAALLENPSAQIREETLDRIVERAPEVIAWHRPLVTRPLLPANAARKLARFVAGNLLTLLAERRDLDPITVKEVRTVVMRRLETEQSSEEKPASGRSSSSRVIERARALHASGALDESAVVTALGNDRAFARAALAVLGDLPLELVDRVLGAHSAKGVTALAWRCGLSMRAAVKIQVQLGQIQPPAVLQPRSDGHYPMNEDAMRWQLEFFGDLAHGAARS